MTIIITAIVVFIITAAICGRQHQLQNPFRYRKELRNDLFHAGCNQREINRVMAMIDSHYKYGVHGGVMGHTVTTTEGSFIYMATEVVIGKERIDVAEEKDNKFSLAV